MPGCSAEIVFVPMLFIQSIRPLTLQALQVAGKLFMPTVAFILFAVQRQSSVAEFAVAEILRAEIQCAEIFQGR